MFEGLKKLFRGAPSPENLYNLAMQSEGRNAPGWYQERTQADTLLGVSWACPGRTITTTAPRPKGSAEPGEMVVDQRIGCAFSTGIIPPDFDGFSRVSIKCRQCGTESKLADYLKHFKMDFRDLPVRIKTNPVSQPRVFDTWSAAAGGAEDGYSYERSDPGSAGFL